MLKLNVSIYRNESVITLKNEAHWYCIATHSERPFCVAPVCAHAQRRIKVNGVADVVIIRTNEQNTFTISFVVCKTHKHIATYSDRVLRVIHPRTHSRSHPVLRLSVYMWGVQESLASMMWRSMSMCKTLIVHKETKEHTLIVHIHTENLTMDVKTKHSSTCSNDVKQCVCVCVHKWTYERTKHMQLVLCRSKHTNLLPRTLRSRSLRPRTHCRPH